MRKGEWHITVEGNNFQNVLRWSAFCAQTGIKPLWIELNDYRRQLMCAARENVSRDIHAAGFDIIRVKHEVQPTCQRLDISTHKDILPMSKFLDVPAEVAVYYECHVKFDGPFKPIMPMASRDLLRESRWYMTSRATQPFDYAALVHEACGANPDCRFAGYEYEAALIDSNPGLDKGWR